MQKRFWIQRVGSRDDFRAVADEVTALLAGKRLTVVDNLLPSFDAPNPDPARDAIRAIFLATIVKGKGLDVIMAATGSAPVPTPFAVLEYVRAIHQHVAGWDSFMLFDMGGATTDVYSAHREAPEPGTLLRGLPEPDIKRTVEGDLGLRVSAQTTARLASGAAQALFERAGMNSDELKPEHAATRLAAHAERLTAHPDSLPADAEEEAVDLLLAGLCVGHAGARHAGRSTTVYTPEGEMQLQTGRDLRRVRQVIGSGGWLSRNTEFNPAQWFTDHSIDQRGRSVLLPRHLTYYRDEDYLFPLLANLARAFPGAAAHAGIRWLSASRFDIPTLSNTEHILQENACN